MHLHVPHNWHHDRRPPRLPPRRRTVTTPQDPDTAAELRKVRAEIAAIRMQVIREQETREHRHDPPPPDPPDALPVPPVTLRGRLAAWLAGKDAQHDHDAEVRASRRRWYARRRDSKNWRRHHGGSP